MCGGMVRPEVHGEDVLRSPQVLAHLEDTWNRRGNTCSLVDLRALGSDGHLFLSGETDRLATDRIVLTQRVAFPVVLHEDAPVGRVAVEADTHQVEGLTLVPVCGRPDIDEARNMLAVVDPDLQPHARRAGTDPEQVVADREPVRFWLRETLEALRRRLVQITAARRADVTGDTLCAPAEVVGGGNVREVVEAQFVSQVQGG